MGSKSKEISYEEAMVTSTQTSHQNGVGLETFITEKHPRVY